MSKPTLRETNESGDSSAPHNTLRGRVEAAINKGWGDWDFNHDNAADAILQLIEEERGKAMEEEANGCFDHAQEEVRAERQRIVGVLEEYFDKLLPETSQLDIADDVLNIIKEANGISDPAAR